VVNMIEIIVIEVGVLRVLAVVFVDGVVMAAG